MLRYGVVILTAAVTVSPLATQQRYEDPNGSYALDLPAGWRMSQDMGAGVKQFKAAGIETFVVGFLAGQQDLTALCEMSLGAFRGSASDVQPDGQVVDLRVNDNPGRWGVYRGQYAAGAQRVPLWLLAGCVALPGSGGGVYFFAILNERSRQALGSTLERVFQSIRGVDAAVTGVSAAAKPAAEPAGPGPGTSTPFTHPLVSLTLPPGWVEQPRAPNAEPEVIATFAKAELVANVVLAGQRRFGSLDEIFQKAVNAVRVAVPNARADNPPFIVTTESGEQVRVQVLSGSLVVEGREIPLGAMVAATRNSNRGLSLQAYFGSAHATRAGEEVGAILRSLR